jgi:outer membrane protein assembly factor BamD (BamD/ComL family)
LARLPWEFLYDPRQGEYVCMSRDTPVVRYIELPQPIKPLSVAPPLCILGMVSSPSNLPTLDLAREKQRLEKAIASLQAENLVKLTWLAAPTWRELQRAMRAGPWHIFHFIGHGGFDPAADEGLIAFEDESGKAQLLLATELGRLLADHRSLRLALLNACEGARASQHDIFSSSAAVLVRRGLPAVLAMQYAITDRAAIEFSRAFYEALADGLPVDAAVCEARKAISLAITNTIEWGTPVLYMRSPQGIIFELPESTGKNLTGVRQPLTQDKEIESHIDRLYMEGRAAFWIEDWDRACARFQAILDIRSDHPEAAAALKEANQNRQRAALYACALEAQQAEKWGEAVSALEALIEQSPDYKDATALLQSAHKKKQLADLYAEARKLHAARQWQAVVRVFEQIHSLQADYPDTDGLLPSAEREVIELKRLTQLDAAYGQSIRAMDGGRWQEALSLLEKVQADEPGYRDVESLFKRAQAEVEKAQKTSQQQERVNTLYEQAHGLLRARQWRKSLDKLEEIYTIDDTFTDSDELASKAKSALEHDEQEAQRQSELSVMYAEAVRLLKDEKYQEALEKWNEIHAWDPKFPDRQKVQQAAKKKLADLGKSQIKKPALWLRIKWRRVGQVVLLALVLVALSVVVTNSQPPVSEGKQPAGTQAGAAAVGATQKAPAAATPRPTATKVASTLIPTPIDDNSLLYVFDNFNDTNFDGQYNNRAWQFRAKGKSGTAVQNNGILDISHIGGDSWLEIDALGYQSFKLQTPLFVEARMKLNPIDGGLGFDITNVGNTILGTCSLRGLGGDDYVAHCFGSEERVIASLPSNNDWHLLRIEINPEDSTITFYIDSLKIGNQKYELDFRKENFRISIYSWITEGVPDTQVLHGFFDYVRIGELQVGAEYYDNFDDPGYDGRYNTAKWKAGGDVSSGEFFQENGRLMLNLTGPEKGLGIGATNVGFPLPKNKYSYLEVKTNSLSGQGVLSVQFWTNKTFFLCGIDNTQGSVRKLCWREDRGGGGNFKTILDFSAREGRDYIITVKVDPFEGVVYFYFDSQKLASYTLDGDETLPEGLGLGCYVSSDLEFQGYFDYVKIYSADE